MPSCVQGDEVRVLSRILASDRRILGDTTLLFAAGALDVLVARADRILILEGHAARAIDPREFRRQLAGHLAAELMTLEAEGGTTTSADPGSQDNTARPSSSGEGPGGGSTPSRIHPDEG